MKDYEVQILGGEKSNVIFAEFNLRAHSRGEAESIALDIYAEKHCHNPETLWLLKAEAVDVKGEAQ